jgi:hypothetical protein
VLEGAIVTPKQSALRLGLAAAIILAVPALGTAPGAGSVYPDLALGASANPILGGADKYVW